MLSCFTNYAIMKSLFNRALLRNLWEDPKKNPTATVSICNNYMILLVIKISIKWKL